MAKVILTRDAAHDLEGLPLVIHVRIISLLERLENWPATSDAKPLTGRLAGRYRLRTGDYRLQFRLKEHDVIVDKIGHRDKFYE